MLEPLSPVFAIGGGLLIGGAAALLLMLTGRIAGVSGMFATVMRIADAGPPWKLATAFILGLPIGAAITSLLVRRPDIEVKSSMPLLIAAGLLVGFGTRLGNGCTSGHGVCGIGRLSPRSIAATLTFMAAAIATVFITRHVLGA
ncbi:YeeE/YedE family protein [Sphingomonas sediminicola]|uniref:YeeE/YedE family protein n=1 Tax=Sphingomonas sediminicola TaxID=386874 RepID=A0ABX6T4X7_9SPHN|nr:YeeE/YedE thiosulfate transporter family protein [Sphingomonas sediminicola]QNP44932.1 YeeE/YedE family protein [Sphingomonas sediminicola]